MAIRFSGNLSQVPLAELLEKVAVGAESGVLSFVTPVNPAAIWVRNGEPIDAEMGPRAGLGVFEVLALLEHATFEFEAQAIGRPRRILLTPRQLVAHCRRYVLETSRWIATLPALTEAIGVPQLDAAASPEEQELARSVRAGVSYLNLLVEATLSPTETLRYLCTWARQLAVLREQAGAGSVRGVGEHDSVRLAGRVNPVISDSEPGGVPAELRSVPLGFGIPARESHAPAGSDAPPADSIPAGLFSVSDEFNVEAALKAHRTPPPRALPNAPWVPQAPSLPPAALGVAITTEVTAQPRTLEKARTLLAFPVGDVEQVLALGNTREGDSEPAMKSSRPSARVGHPGTQAQADEQPPPSSYLPGTTVMLPITSDVAAAQARAGQAFDTGPLFDEKVLLSAGERFFVHLVRKAASGAPESGTEPSSGLFALKTPRPGLPDASAALENEALRLGQCVHNNVVSVERFGTDAGLPYLLTRYVYGVTLAELLQAPEPLEQPLLLRIVTEVVRGLVFLHDPARPGGSVVHCNVSPQNILIDTEGEVRLLGFSSACNVARGKATGQAGYEPGYTSPELTRGEQVSTLMDVYSVGVLLAEGLGIDPQTVAAPGSIAAVANQARDANKERRQQSTAELLQQLTQLNPHGVDQRSLAAWVRFATRPSRRPSAPVSGPRSQRPAPAARFASRVAGVLLVVAVLVFAAWSVLRALST